MTSASVTGSTGGLSMSSRSQRLSSASTMPTARCEARSSAGFGRTGAGRDESDGEVAAYALDRLGDRHVAEQHRREPDAVRQPEELVDARAAHVAAEHDDPLPGAGERRREVREGGGLAFARERARDLQTPDRLVEAQELDGRADRAVRLGRG